jgi:hypothetical protein
MKDTFKHTPGPWWTDDPVEPDYIFANDGMVAEMRGYGHNAPREANARLISAAPEMYEGGDELNALVVKAQEFLARAIVPDSGIIDVEVVNEMLGIFDGPQQRQAQAKWAAAVAKVEGR